MANSYIDYTGDGSLTAFTTPEYLEQSHLVVSVGGVIKNLTTDYTLSGTTCTFATAPANTAKIRIARNTSQNLRLTDYSDASLLTADAMDRDAKQLFFMAQEAVDTASETNLAASTFYSSGTTLPTTSEIGALFFNTTTGKLKIWDGTLWLDITSSADRQTFLGSAMQDSSTYSNYKFYSTSQNISLNTQVFLNGVKLNATAMSVPPTDGTAGTQDYYRGQSPTYANAVYIRNPQANDVLEVIHLTNTVGGSIASVDGNVSFTSKPTTLNIGALPTSSSGLEVGDLYVLSGQVKVKT